MELIYAIALYLDVPNEWIVIDKVIEDGVWFTVKNYGVSYTCTTVRSGKYLKKNSIRRDFYN
jgi:hypothetical protein